MINFNDFVDDIEKVRDLLYLSKEEFLESYSYIEEAEYENTVNKILNYTKTRKKSREKQNEKRNADLENARKKNMEYYYANREKINARRRELKKQRKEAGLI